jgi:hypothetical protein
LGAHVGSPDVFFQGKAGPYPLLVAIRPPDVIPGVARIEVRALSGDVSEIQLTPTPMTGIAATHPPVADIAQRSQTDPRFFEGALWLMSTGSWEVRIRVSGEQGSGELPVPVPAVALRTRPMNRGVSYFLIGMMVFLTVGLVAIVGAGVREAQLSPGKESGARWSRPAVIAMGCVSIVLIFALWQGAAWWGEDAATYTRNIYKPLQISLLLNSGHVEMRLTDPGWLPLRKLDDLLPDHGHLMHLFLVRWPAMDRVYHLHPDETAPGYFTTLLPSLEGGTYRIYGDVVHASGFAETAVGETTLPEVHGKALSDDDAAGPSLPAGGFQMVWLSDQTKPISATELNLFAFEIVGPDGKPVNDLQPYMGMGGHAEFIKQDGSVFAHVHPTGSVPMASVAVASPVAMMAMHETKPGPIVSFPYGVPTPGKYRIFVQMKRAGKVETGSFEFTASPAIATTGAATGGK